MKRVMFFLFAAQMFFCGCNNVGSGAAAENSAPAAPQKRVVFAYGNSIHFWGDHENKIFCELLRDAFNSAAKGRARAETFDLMNSDLSGLSGADAVLVFSEGEQQHPFKNKLDALKKLNDSGVSFAFFHYATTPLTKDGEEALKDIIGGTYENFYSVNPSWKADFKLGDSEILNGVPEFSFYDEIYFNFRFKDGAKIIPILKATPPDRVRKFRPGAHTGNKTVRENMGREEVVYWACENSNGTRGAGSAIGHSVWALNNDAFRTLVLNTAAWLAKMEIPQGGLKSAKPSRGEIISKIEKDLRADFKDYLKKVDENFYK